MPDMSPEEKALVRDDCQRAAALVVHHSRNDADGFNVCLQEAVAADRATQLYIAILDLYASLLPELRTPIAQHFLADWVTRSAGTDIT